MPHFPTDAPVQLEQKCTDGFEACLVLLYISSNTCLRILVTNILLTKMFSVLLGGVKRVAHGKNEGEDEDGDGIKSDWACPH